MVTLTLNTDPATYQAMHAQMLELALPAGMLFHSAHDAGGQVGVVDFWPDEETWNAFARGPLSEGMKAAGIDPPGDVRVTPVLNADSR